MDDRAESFLREGAAIKLTADEKTGMKTQLQAYMQRAKEGLESLTAREFDEGRDQLEKFIVANPAVIHTSMFESISLFTHGLVWRLSAVTAAFLVIGSSLAVAAQSTLPGDWLYPLKVDVYEPIKGALILSAEAKSAWEAEKSIRRLQEIDQLSADESLSQEEWNVLHQDFIRFAEQADKQISALSLKAKRELVALLSADLDRYLNGHHAVMQARGNADDSVIFQRVSVKQATGETFTGGSYRRGTVDEMMDSVSGNDEQSRVLAQTHVNNALRAVAQLKERLKRNHNASDNAEAKLKKAEDQLSEASELFSIGRFTDAVMRAREAERTANEGQNILQYSGSDR